MKRFLSVMAVALGGVMTHAQVPEVYTVLPRAARAGEVVRIIGQDFDWRPGSNIVHIGGVRAQVRESWVTELEVEVPQAAQEGAITVATGGTLAVSPTRFQPLFAPFGESNAVYRRAVLPSSNYVGATTADLNGDGGAELLLVNRDALVDVYEYVPGSPLISAASFQHRAVLAGSINSTNLMVVDFDADGRIDILTGSPTGFELFRNVHEGGLLSGASFAPQVRVNRGSPQVLGMELADVDRDGRVDVITREATTVSFHLNTYVPNGTNQWLGPRIPITPSSNSDTRTLAVGDLNGDGHVEIAIASGEGLRIFSHNSRTEASNRFTLVTIPMVGVSFIHLLDVEGDGLLDILTHSGTTRRYDLLHNRNQGVHLEAGNFELVRLAQQDLLQLPPKILDLNGDGFQDWVGRTSASGSPTGVFYENQSRFVGNVIFQGSFLAVTNVITNSPVVITADLNRDGAQDVITVHRGVHVFQNVSAQPLSIAGIQMLGTPPTVSILVFGQPNAVLTLQSSADLKGWAMVVSGRVTFSGFWEYRNTAPGKMRFYRVQPAIPP